jgi:hypothetical protein
MKRRAMVHAGNHLMTLNFTRKAAAVLRFVQVESVARCIDALEDVERRAGAQRCAVAASRAAKIKADLGTPIPFGLGIDIDSPVAFDRDLARVRLESSGSSRPDAVHGSPGVEQRRQVAGASNSRPYLTF